MLLLEFLNLTTNTHTTNKTTFTFTLVLPSLTNTNIQAKGRLGDKERANTSTNNTQPNTYIRIQLTLISVYERNELISLAPNIIPLDEQSSTFGEEVEQKINATQEKTKDLNSERQGEGDFVRTSKSTQNS